MSLPSVESAVFPETDGEWRRRLSLVVDTMREMSRQTDPQAMVHAYGARMRELRPVDRLMSLSRRGLEFPRFRITRCSLWEDEINPWREPHRLPLLAGGLLGELLYGDEPRIIDDLDVAADDPAAEYLAGQRSLLAIPNFDGGVAVNMVILMREFAGAFQPDDLPEAVWMSNLFGRATHNLVLSDKVKQAYDAIDAELKMVADIQRSLLPTQLPAIPTLELAAHYQTARRAGGDYYDFFPLPDDRWGILIADVSGHGTAAAVLMAITHSIAHAYPGPATPAGRMLEYVNRQLAARYTGDMGTFVTAFYGIYDPRKRELSYACAGHNPPRLKRCGDGSVTSVDGCNNLPLGIAEDETYQDVTLLLRPADQIVFYTDGVTEAHNPAGEMFGLERLDGVLGRCQSAHDLIGAVLAAVDDFTAGEAALDDRTLLVAKVS